MGKTTRPSSPIPSAQPVVFLVRRDGEKTAHASRRALLERVGMAFIVDQVGEQFDRLRSHWSPFAGVAGPDGRLPGARRVERDRFDWVIRDAGGAPLTADDFSEAQAEIRAERLASRRRLGRWSLWRLWSGEGPVPGTGRPGRGRWLRHPATHAENRLNAWRDAEEGEPAARAKRKKLPTAWDDQWIRSQSVRSWKRHRAAQAKDSGARRERKKGMGGDFWEQEPLG